MGIIILLVFMVAMWAFLLLPQQRRMKAHQALLAKIEAGDQVITNSGIYGVITEIDDDSLFLEVAEGIEIKIQRQAIQDYVYEVSDDVDTDTDELVDDE